MNCLLYVWRRRFSKLATVAMAPVVNPVKMTHFDIESITASIPLLLECLNLAANQIEPRINNYNKSPCDGRVFREE